MQFVLLNAKFAITHKNHRNRCCVLVLHGFLRQFWLLRAASICSFSRALWTEGLTFQWLRDWELRSKKLFPKFLLVGSTLFCFLNKPGGRCQGYTVSSLKFSSPIVVMPPSANCCYSILLIKSTEEQQFTLKMAQDVFFGSSSLPETSRGPTTFYKVTSSVNQTEKGTPPLESSKFDKLLHRVSISINSSFEGGRPFSIEDLCSLLFAHAYHYSPLPFFFFDSFCTQSLLIGSIDVGPEFGIFSSFKKNLRDPSQYSDFVNSRKASFVEIELYSSLFCETDILRNFENFFLQVNLSDNFLSHFKFIDSSFNESITVDDFYFDTMGSHIYDALKLAPFPKFSDFFDSFLNFQTRLLSFRVNEINFFQYPTSSFYHAFTDLLTSDQTSSNLVNYAVSNENQLEIYLLFVQDCFKVRKLWLDFFMGKVKLLPHDERSRHELYGIPDFTPIFSAITNYLNQVLTNYRFFVKKFYEITFQEIKIPDDKDAIFDHLAFK